VRMLVVDDEPMMGATLRVTLRDHFDIELSPSGEHARARLEGGELFDVILTDLMMPGLSGMQLHAWLLERSSAQAAHMIFMTGGAYTNEANEFLRRIPNPHVQKPFELDELLDAIASLES